MVYRAEAQHNVLILLEFYSYCHISLGRDAIQIPLSAFLGEKLPVDVGCRRSFFLTL